MQLRAAGRGGEGRGGEGRFGPERGVCDAGRRSAERRLSLFLSLEGESAGTGEIARLRGELR